MKTIITYIRLTVAMILSFGGLLMIAGAAGSVDLDRISSGEAMTLVVIGFAMLGVGCLVGRFTKESDE